MSQYSTKIIALFFFLFFYIVYFRGLSVLDTCRFCLLGNEAKHGRDYFYCRVLC